MKTVKEADHIKFYPSTDEEEKHLNWLAEKLESKIKEVEETN